MPTLYILIGAAGAGKSTFASKFMNENTIWVSRDNIRFRYLDKNPEAHYFDFEKETFQDFINEIVAALKNNYNAIADATHLNTASRKKLTNAIDKYYKNYKIIYIVFITDAGQCIKHNANRTGHRFVPKEIIQDMRSNLTIPKNEDTRAVGTWLIEGEI